MNPNHHFARINPVQAEELSGNGLKACLAQLFPEVNEGEALAYVAGEGIALTMVGLSNEEITDIITKWSGVDAKAYVGMLYGLANQKISVFSSTLVAASTMPPPGMTQ